jgi:hypothetical protein
MRGAALLDISARALRNKLNESAQRGIPSTDTRAARPAFAATSTNKYRPEAVCATQNK